MKKINKRYSIIAIILLVAWISSLYGKISAHTKKKQLTVVEQKRGNIKTCDVEKILDKSRFDYFLKNNFNSNRSDSKLISDQCKG